MFDLTIDDKEFIDNSYKSFLLNLKFFLECGKDRDALEYSKIVIDMLHKGQFSMNRKIVFCNDHNYLSLPSIISNGVYVTYGICCCRHATFLLNDILCSLGFDFSLMYIFVDKDGNWHKINPTVDKCNHVVIVLTNKDHKYYIDAANKFLLEQIDNHVLSLDVNPLDNSLDYQDTNIIEIGKVLKKYYMYRELGIDHVYEYKY